MRRFTCISFSKRTVCASHQKYFVMEAWIYGTAFAYMRLGLKAQNPREKSLGFCMARCKGFEPLAFWSVAKRSIQLS